MFTEISFQTQFYTLTMQPKPAKKTAYGAYTERKNLRPSSRNNTSRNIKVMRRVASCYQLFRA